MRVCTDAARNDGGIILFDHGVLLNGFTQFMGAQHPADTYRSYFTSGAERIVPRLSCQCGQLDFAARFDIDLDAPVFLHVLFRLYSVRRVFEAIALLRQPRGVDAANAHQIIHDRLGAAFGEYLVVLVRRAFAFVGMPLDLGGRPWITLEHLDDDVELAKSPERMIALS